MKASDFNKKLIAWQDIYYKISENLYLSNKIAALKNNYINYYQPSVIICCGEKYKKNIKHKDVIYKNIFGISLIDVMRSSYRFIEQTIISGKKVCLFGKWAPECAVYYYLLRVFKIKYPGADKPQSHLSSIIEFVQKGCPAFEVKAITLDILMQVEDYLIKSVKGELTN